MTESSERCARKNCGGLNKPWTQNRKGETVYHQDPKSRHGHRPGAYCHVFVPSEAVKT
jgi:hypothetical protein